MDAFLSALRPLIPFAILLLQTAVSTAQTSPATAEEVFRRPVSLTAENMSLLQALGELARAAGLRLNVDFEALAKTELELAQPVTVTIKDEQLSDALLELVDWNSYPGVYRELRNGELFITTVEAAQARTAAALPDWLKPVYGNGLLADLGDGGGIFRIHAGAKLTDEMLAQFPSLPELRKLEFSNAHDLTAAGLKSLAQLTALEELSIHDLQHDGQHLGNEAISKIVDLKSLRKLSLNECGTTDAGIKMLEQMPQLTHLSIYQEGRLTDAAVQSIAQLKNLKLLSLNNYVSTSLGKMQFTRDATKALAGLEQLEHLHLVGHEVFAETLKFPKLKSLSLGDIVVNDACAARIAECRELESLSLVYTGITDDGMRRISELSHLKWLNIDSLVITDAGIAHLMKLPKLTSISLRCSQLTDKSLAHLAKIKTLERIELNSSRKPGFHPGDCFSAAGLVQLKDLPKLRTLWLTNFATTEGYGGLKELSQLRELNLMMVDIRRDEYDMLEDALPKTRLTHMTGGGGYSMFPRKKRR